MRPSQIKKPRADKNTMGKYEKKKKTNKFYWLPLYVIYLIVLWNLGGWNFLFLFFNLFFIIEEINRTDAGTL